MTWRTIAGFFLSHQEVKTKKQMVVYCSSAEVEYCAMAITTVELLQLCSPLRSLGVIHTQSIELACDSKAGIQIVANLVFHEKTKHIKNDCHFI